MVERGEAQEIGTAASTGGRCAMQYRLNPQYRLFLCLRLEQDTLHWFVCDLDGTPLKQEQQTCSGDVRELLDTLLMRVGRVTRGLQRWCSALPERCITASSPRALATLSCGA